MANIVTNGLQVYLNSQQGVSGTTWSDLSGNNNNGTIHGTVAVQSGYMTFPGASTGYVSIPLPTAVAGSTTWTVEAYLKPTNAGTYPDFMASSTAGGTVEFGMNTDGANIGTVAPTLYTTGLTSSTWSTAHFVSITYDGTTETIYIDGAKNTSGSPASNEKLCASGTTLYLSDNYAWAGIIDCVRVYNRALSSAEVSQNYSVGTAVGLASGGTAYSKTVTDSIATPSDTLTKNIHSTRTDTNSTPTDSVSTGASHNYTQTVTDSINAPTDSVTTGASLHETVADTNASPTDSTSTSTSHIKTVLDAITATETLTKQVSTTRTDSFTATDQAGRLHTAMVADSISSPTDSATGGRETIIIQSIALVGVMNPYTTLQGTLNRSATLQGTSPPTTTLQGTKASTTTLGGEI